MSDPPASRQPRGFRAQQRFSFPAQVIPLDWTAPTPPHGFPAQPAPAAVPSVAVPAVPSGDAVAVQLADVGTPPEQVVTPPQPEAPLPERAAEPSTDDLAKPSVDGASRRNGAATAPLEYLTPTPVDVALPTEFAAPTRPADAAANPPDVALPLDVTSPSLDVAPPPDVALPVDVVPPLDVTSPEVADPPPLDLAPPPDVPPPPDVTLPVDVAPPADVIPPLELAPPLDLAPPPDVTPPEDATPPPLEFVALTSFTPVSEPPLDLTPPPVDPPADTSSAPQRAPVKGWRRWLHKSARQEMLVGRADRPLSGCYRIALLSLKGGVGKTTVTATLGATLASVRADRVIAVDANPDRGTLSQKVPLETASTVRHLLRDAEGISTYDDVRKYTSRGSSRLEVLASESDPAVSEAFSAADYDQTLAVLERFYNLVLTDCGTGLLHSAMSSVLSSADLLVVVSSGAVDGARSASATLDWLNAHGYEQLVRDSVAVVNAVRPRSGRVNLGKVDDHFSRRCRAVVHVPFDPHLEAGAEIDLARLKAPTRDALLELASVVADGFPEPDESP